MLTDEQKHAVEVATHAPVSVITGGPGTGKTTTMRAVVEACHKRGERVRILAPTGKAVVRITQQTGHEASTIHRGVGWHPETATPEYHRLNPWPEQAIIVDEASMIDVALASRLVSAVGPRSRLVIVGDPNQLPPVAPGSFLVDVLASGAAAHVELSQVFRQGAGSPIIEAAYDILRGVMPKSAKNDAGSFHVIERSTDGLRDIVMDLVTTRIPRAFGHSDDESIQVLAPRREGPMSVASMNDALVTHFNPSAAHVARGVFPGDKVINTKNDYELGVFNGETGRVTGYSWDGDVEVRFPDRSITFPDEAAKALHRAWCLSVHKSQGSEYPVTIVVLCEAHGRLLFRELLYTAVTRAKGVCVVVASPGAIGRCLKNRMPTRESSLADRVKQLASGPR